MFNMQQKMCKFINCTFKSCLKLKKSYISRLLVYINMTLFNLKFCDESIDVHVQNENI